MLAKLFLLLLLDVSFGLSFKVLVCPTLHVKLNRLNSTTTLDTLIVDLVLQSTSNGGNSLYIQNFNHTSSNKVPAPLMFPVYKSLWKSSQSNSQENQNLDNVADGPGSLQFLDASGNNFGPGINIGINIGSQSQSFYNVDGTFFANISKCYGGNEKSKITKKV